MNRNDKDIYPLAIIIPYYKINYFDALLDALSKQTNSNFTIYIGNDSSPDDPSKIIEKYEDKLNITYKKFETNLGGTSLIKQWERCLEMVGDEEWVWVLPDDDVPSHNVVEEFYKALQFKKQYNIKVFRVPLNFIDETGIILSEAKSKEILIENNYDFYMNILQGKTASSLGDNIFHRKSLEDTGGFVNFPKAWLSDHATVLNVASGGNIYYLKDATFNFRMSGANISSDNSDGLIKIQSRILFVKWLKENEHIFTSKPSEKFYKYVYWKGEYYVLHEWSFNIYIFKYLFQLRKICFDSINILPILSIFLQKIMKVKNEQTL